MPPFLEKPQNMVGNPGIQVPHGGDTQIGLGENAASIISANTCTVDADINSTQTTTVYCNRPSFTSHRFSIFLSLGF